MDSKERLLQALKHNFGETINKYLEDKEVIEIMLNPDKKLWIERLGKPMEFTGIEIPPEISLIIINTIAHHMGTIVNIANTNLDAELPETGFRFNAVIPPNVDNPYFTIRKKSNLVFSLDNYVESKAITENQKLIIEKAILDHKNILIVGGTSTGKTTFANAVIRAMPKQDRLVIIEDTQELQSLAPNTVYFKTSENADITKMLKTTMRARPDRIIVGEIRGGEALHLLTAWNSGHPGGLCTIHSDDALGGLKQLEQYIQRVSVDKQQELISKVVNLIIVLKRVEGIRKVIQICEVIDFKNNSYLLKEVSNE